MKDQLQQELLAKVKPGTKPSDLKKLRRSRSTGEIPKAPPLPKSLAKSKSAEELETTPTKEELETKISVLELELEVQKRETTEKEVYHQAQNQILADQLKEKQTQVEELRKQLETQANPTELDQSLIARHQNLKD